ncbi:caspase family protein [Xanthobacter sp. 91]|uniref:caspase family protein n=1 Tax=Xanthobacter sp. 91 TaxID=1117244 RepID=UPI0004983876|nr:caspase family protein [Xanthobacter sp. 91]
MTLNADALIIGIDKYDSAQIRPLPGCVNDAVTAANWLIAIGVPVERIIVHVSPLAQEAFAAGINVKPADDSAIRASFKRLSKGAGGDQLFVFMSGHGKHVLGAGPVFLCQDYYVYESTRENLAIIEYIEWFRSWRYRDQFLFYDACQDDTASIGEISAVEASGPDAPAGTYSPDPAVAFTVCYACSPGERAWAGDGRGVLVRYSLAALDPTFWNAVDANAPEQDAIVYDWGTGKRVVDLVRLFTNTIAAKIEDAANAGDRYQRPFCQSHGRALADGYSPILQLPLLATTNVTVLVDPEIAFSDVVSIRLQSQLLPRPFFMPFKGIPLKIPTTIKFPSQYQLNAGCQLTPGSSWRAVNVPLVEELSKPDVDIVLELRQPPPASPPADDGKGDINIMVDGGRGSLPPEILDQLARSTEQARSVSPPGVTFGTEAGGPVIRFNPRIPGSAFTANRIGVDWLKATRRYNRASGKQVILSPAGQPRYLQPNIHFDFGEASAAEIAGYLQDDECVTLDSLADELPPRKLSLRDLEEHPLDWLEPGQCRISVDLPWGRWTTRVRTGDKIVSVRLPPRIGLEPLRNRHRLDDPSGPRLINPVWEDGTSSPPFELLLLQDAKLWALATMPVPLLVQATKAGLRVEPFSETTLREWDELLTVGRLNVDDAAGLIKRLRGELPGGSADDFVVLALAAAYAEYDKQNWAGMQTILEIIDERKFNAPDVVLLKTAMELADEALTGQDRLDALRNRLASQPLRLPMLRWGVRLLLDLIGQAELVPPAWITMADSASVVTLINQNGLAALGYDPDELLIQIHHDAERRSREERIPAEIPVWLQDHIGGDFEQLAAPEVPRALLEGPTTNKVEAGEAEQEQQMREE